MSFSQRNCKSDVAQGPKSPSLFVHDDLPIFNRDAVNTHRLVKHTLALSIEDFQEIQEIKSPTNLYNISPIAPPKTALRSPNADRARAPNFEKDEGVRQYRLLQRSQSASDLTLVAKRHAHDYHVPTNCMEGLFLSKRNGAKVYQRIWLPEGRARCILFISHGFGEHCGRYDAQAAEFNKRGFLVVAHDHQGHGRSGGPRADISDYNIYVSDIQQSIKLIIKTYSAMSVYGWGHAMGAAFILSIARESPEFFAGLLLTAPLVMPDPLASTRFKKILARHIAKLNPKFSLGHLDPRNLTTNADYIRSWRKDPLVYHGDIRIHWANEMLKGASENFKNLNKIVTPFVIFQGTWDDVVIPEGAMYLYNRSNSENKQLRMFEELMHDLHNEPDEKGMEVITELIAWVEESLGEEPGVRIPSRQASVRGVSNEDGSHTSISLEASEMLDAAFEARKASVTSV